MHASSPYSYPADESAANFNVFWNGVSPLNTEIQAGYDNFRINSGTISCPNWWDDSAPDWQATKMSLTMETQKHWRVRTKRSSFAGRSS